ncbi:MAG: hypothetical protein EA396_01595 [Anaerolineaceae bacterium]|nr:MAG: hypothetical protein EA396_01595 [Anaerolineaceae bacterium]
MIEAIARKISPLLEVSIVRQVRRNHALEHATAHMLARRVPDLRLSGRASDDGFILICDVPQETMEAAAHEGLERLRAGEGRWAVHPNCGTNLVTLAALTTGAGVVGLGGNRQLTSDRISFTMLLMIPATMIARPLGMSLQKHITTKGDPGDLEIVSVKRHTVKIPFINKQIVYYRVNTRRG